MTQYQPFRAFNPHAPVRIYRRDLPHWRQDGCTYFVTTRLADSIPKNILLDWRDQRQHWYAAHGLHTDMPPGEWKRQYVMIAEKERKAFERRQARQRLLELDKCHGRCKLKDLKIANLVLQACRHFDGQRLQCGDLVVMPNHIHWLVMPLLGFELESIMQSIARFTAIRINRMMKKTGPFWKKEPYDHLVRDRVELRRIRQYIADNPTKAGLCDKGFLYHRADWLDEGARS